MLLRRVNAGPLFIALGMLPIENELGSSRDLAAFAWTVQRRHGPLPLSEIFDERVAATISAGYEELAISGARISSRARTKS